MLEIIGLIANLIISSKDRGFQPLISPVTLFGYDVMGGTFVVL